MTVKEAIKDLKTVKNKDSELIYVYDGMEYPIDIFLREPNKVQVGFGDPKPRKD